MLSISDEHKEAIIRLINAIVSDSPVITNLSDRSKVSHKLVKLIHYFEHSVQSGNKSLLLLKCLSFEALIENWLLHYYCEDSVMSSFAIEDGVEQELSTASLLILYVIFKFTVCFPHIVMYFNDNWKTLEEFNTRLDQMMKTDKIIKLLYKQIDNNCSKNTDNNQSLSNSEMTETMKNEDLSAFDSNSFSSQIQSQVSTINGLNGFPQLNLKPNTYHSIDELIVPQMLNNCQLCEPNPNPNQPEGQTPLIFQCNDCNRSFASKYKLRRHAFVHQPLSKPFKCSWTGCELRFRSSFDMRRHYVTHTGERRFGCDICSKRFSRADKLKEHQFVHKRSEERRQQALNNSQSQGIMDLKPKMEFNLNNNINPNELQMFEMNKSEDFGSFDVNSFNLQMLSILKTEPNV